MRSKNRVKHLAHEKREQKNNPLEQKQAERKHELIVNTTETHMNTGDAQCKARAVQDAANSTTSSVYTEGGQSRQVQKDDKRCRAVRDMHLDDKDTEMTIQVLYVIRSKIFNFHSAVSIIIANLNQNAAKNRYM